MPAFPIGAALRAGVATLLLCVSFPVFAAGVPDVVLQGVQGSKVVVTRVDGAEVAGTLLSYDGNLVVVTKADGSIVVVKRPEIETLVRAVTAAPPGPSPSAAAAVAAPLPGPLPSTAPAADASADTDVRKRIEELRAEAGVNRKSGVQLLTFALPLGITGVGLGTWAVYTADDGFDVALGAALSGVGAVLVVVSPISGALDLVQAARADKEADALEKSLVTSAVSRVRVTSVAPAPLRDGAAIVLGGSF